MNNIREIVARMVARVKHEENYPLQLVLQTILKCFQTINALSRQNRRSGSARHLLLNVGTGGKKPAIRDIARGCHQGFVMVLISENLIRIVIQPLLVINFVLYFE
jgi:hypothetical protein